MELANIRIAMIGLGYVGLPLAVEFGKKYTTVGFDINSARIDELGRGHDHTLEVSGEELTEATRLSYTADIEEIKSCNIYIVTVPTPINEYKQPDLSPLESASTLLGKVIKQDDIVIYESTVYPGATEEVLMAAGTKWNFLPFRPGLVGGHCIGVDPYYLTYKAQSIGYNPEIILSGRRINDGMGEYVVSRLIKLMLKKRLHVRESDILIMGLTFKENCPDLRNTRVVDIINELQTYGVNVHVYDPWVDPEEAYKEYGIKPIATLEEGRFDAILLAVAHGAIQANGY